jgi:hypothetical protein
MGKASWPTMELLYQLSYNGNVLSIIRFSLLLENLARAL